VISRLALLCCCAALAAAADAPLACWSTGAGTIAGKPAAEGLGIPAGIETVAGPDGPALVQVVPALIDLTLAADSAVVLGEGTAPDGGRLLTVEVRRGAVQVDVADRKDYAAVLVRGAAMDVRVTGTLFVIERVQKDEDYLAMVEGKVQVNLRPAIAAILGAAGDPIEVGARFGLRADASAGLGAPQAISSRPQLDGAAGKRQPIASQAEKPGGGWDQDAANDALGGGDGLPGGGTGDNGGLPPPPPIDLAIDAINTLQLDLGGSSNTGSNALTGGGGGGGSTPQAIPPPPGPPR
jgi:hypothetical protein